MEGTRRPSSAVALKPVAAEGGKMRKLLVVSALSAALTVAGSAPAWALQTPTTGQPGAPTNTCGTDNPVTPGNSASSPGSPFNSTGQAGNVYAGHPNTA